MRRNASLPLVPASETPAQVPDGASRTDPQRDLAHLVGQQLRLCSFSLSYFPVRYVRDGRSVSSRNGP